MRLTDKFTDRWKSEEGELDADDQENEEEKSERQKEKERKRQKALEERSAAIQMQKAQVAQGIDRSRAGLERGGGEEAFRCVLFHFV